TVAGASGNARQVTPSDWAAAMPAPRKSCSVACGTLPRSRSAASSPSENCPGRPSKRQPRPAAERHSWGRELFPAPSLRGGGKQPVYPVALAWAVGTQCLAVPAAARQDGPGSGMVFAITCGARPELPGCTRRVGPSGRCPTDALLLTVLGSPPPAAPR